MVSAKHERLIRKYARFLEVSPQDFHDWNLGSTIEELGDPRAGVLHAWATSMLDYDTQEEAERMKARYLKWERSKLGYNLNRGREA